ncbi:MAG TPA: hypothetical protein VNR39_19845 [Pseudolabrys sp.]|nr:hypothetical protein [Pseudolabrys sp.]
MDTLHTVLRSIKRETKADTRSGAADRRDHLDVFREFLDHLDRASRRRSVPPRAPKMKAKRGRK